MPPPPIGDPRDERGLVQVPPSADTWEHLVALALLWAVPCVGFVLVMLLGGVHSA